MHTFQKSSLLLVALGTLAWHSTAIAGDLVPLRAGPLSMVFDAENAFLRYVRVGPHEVLRGVNAPIRDQNWSTVKPQVRNLEIKKQGDNFAVTFDVLCQADDIDFRWHGSLIGTAQGVVEFSFDGQAYSTFKRNRIGFCVLHGPSAAGQPWTLDTADGQRTEGRFPKLISPHQPAKNIRAITHEVAPGIRAQVQFKGEVFEMEDQRNWTDASFKTYCTPLEKPYPVEVSQGTKVSQEIRISVDGDLAATASPAASTTELVVGNTAAPLPRLGVQVSGEVADLTDVQVARLRALDLDHLRIDLPLSDETFINDLRRARRQAVALGASLHIALHLGESPQFDRLLEEMNRSTLPVSYWLVAGGDPRHFERVRQRLAPMSADAKFGVTRVTNFVELNRGRPRKASVEAVGFAVNPQIHAFDNASIVETLPIQADAVHTARQFAPGRSLIIGPVTLRPQLVNGEDQPGGPPPGPFPSYVDPRQASPFAAVWTLGSFKHLADARSDAVTYFETVGWNGLMDADDVASRPPNYPSQPGELFPVYHLLREIGEFAGGQAVRCQAADDLRAVGLVLRKSGRLRVLVGNLTAETQSVIVRGLDKAASITALNGDEISADRQLSFDLPPYGIGRLDRTVD